MLTPFTIGSDDEVEPEVLSEDEFGHNMTTAVNHAKKGKIFAFDFDDGQVKCIYTSCDCPWVSSFPFNINPHGLTPVCAPGGEETRL